jgi:hypothetical protein
VIFSGVVREWVECWCGGEVTKARVALDDAFRSAASEDREPEDVRRIRPLRVALQSQCDDLLAFVGVLDKKLVHIAQTHETSEDQRA